MNQQSKPTQSDPCTGDLDLVCAFSPKRLCTTTCTTFCVSILVRRLSSRRSSELNERDILWKLNFGHSLGRTANSSSWRSVVRDVESTCLRYEGLQGLWWWWWWWVEERKGS